MASDIGASRDGMDERLLAARDSALFDGEKVVAQETGDQGQAIVLTDSRIIVIKVGVTATGTVNGQSVTAYAFGDIASAKVRKGPMGAVIQICAEQKDDGSQDGLPDSVVVFGDEQKVKRCDAIAAAIEATLGKPIERIEPKQTSHSAVEMPADMGTPGSDNQPAEVASEVVETNEKQAPKRGIKKASLADEIYAEITGAPTPTPVQDGRAEPEQVLQQAAGGTPITEGPTAVVENETSPEPLVRTAEFEAEPQQDEAENVSQESEPNQSGFRPNPNLPRPTRRRSDGPSKTLILLGGLAALVTVGVCVTAPMRQPPQPVKAVVKTTDIVVSVESLRAQSQAVSHYREQAEAILARSNAEAARFRQALMAGDRQEVAASFADGATDTAWKALRDLGALPGLAGAKQKLVSGVFSRKSAMADAATGAEPDKAAVSRSLEQAETSIKSGFAAIDAMRAELESQISASAKKKD